jgi:hypothetical protein
MIFRKPTNTVPKLCWVVVRTVAKPAGNNKKTVLDDPWETVARSGPSRGVHENAIINIRIYTYIYIHHLLSSHSLSPECANFVEHEQPQQELRPPNCSQTNTNRGKNRERQELSRYRSIVTVNQPMLHEHGEGTNPGPKESPINVTGPTSM